MEPTDEQMVILFAIPPPRTTNWNNYTGDSDESPQLTEVAKDREILWPPMVVIMNTLLKEENQKEYRTNNEADFIKLLEQACLGDYSMGNSELKVDFTDFWCNFTSELRRRCEIPIHVTDEAVQSCMEYANVSLRKKYRDMRDLAVQCWMQVQGIDSTISLENVTCTSHQFLLQCPVNLVGPGLAMLVFLIIQIQW